MSPLASAGARRGQNEAWFRKLNERLEDRALKKRHPSTAFSIVCECGREECVDRIEISYFAYEAIRDQPTFFILAPGHLDPELEELVSRTEKYDVVVKTGDAALVALIEDPRR